MGVLDSLQPLTNQADVAPAVGASTATPDGAAPSWSSAAAASFRGAIDETPFVQDTRLRDAYIGLAGQVAQAANKSPYDYDLPWWKQAANAMDPWGQSDPIDRDAVWRDVASLTAAGYPIKGLTNQQDFESHVLTRGGQHQADAALAAQGGWTANIAGGLAAMPASPANMVAGLVGGPELPAIGEGVLAKALSGAASAGLTNIGVTAAMEPSAIAARARLGEATGIGDVTTDIASAGAFGAAMHGAGAVVSRFIRAVPSIYRTPVEQAAVNVVERNAEVEGSNPFPNSTAAMDLHKQRLNESMADMDNGQLPGSSPAFAPVARSSAPSSDLTPDAIIQFVQGPLEGGAKTVNYSPGDGGVTKFGIAAADNPGVDVANLTADQAQAIAKSKYWFPELDQQSPGMQAVAFDAGYISGKPFGRKLIAESGGDVGRAIDLYRAHLNDIADNIPGKSKYKEGWNARVDHLADFIDKHDGTGTAPGPPRSTESGGEGDSIDAQAGADAQGIAEEQAESADAENADLSPVQREDDASAVERGDAAAPVATAAPAVPAATSEAEAPLSVQVLMPGLRAAIADRTVSLNRIDDLAGALDAHPDDVRAGLQQLAAMGELNQRSDNGAFMRAAGPASGPEDVLTFLARHGGVADDEGHNLGLGLSREERRGLSAGGLAAAQARRRYGSMEWGKVMTPKGRLLRRSGMDIDSVGELLHEAGYMGGGGVDDGARPTTAQVLDFLDKRIRSGEKVYTREDTAARAPERFALPTRDEEIAHRAGWIGDAAEAIGLKRHELDPEFLDHAARLAIDGSMDEHEALLHAINHYLEDARAEAMDEHPGGGYGDDHADDEHLGPVGKDRSGEEDGDRRESVGEDEASGPGGGGHAGGGAAASSDEAIAAGLTAPPHVDSATMQRFDDPDSDAVKKMADSAWHDLLADAGVPDPAIALREAERARLGAEAPLRGENKTGVAQDGTMGLGLFDQADAREFDLGDGKGPRSIADIAMEFADDKQALDAIQGCLG